MLFNYKFCNVFKFNCLHIYLQMDKSSVLGDATKYIKQLQERVKTLEEKAGKKDRSEAVKRSRIHLDEGSSSSDENFDCSLNESNIPEIEVRISERNVLFRVHSKKIPGFTVRMLKQENSRILCFSCVFIV